MSTDALKIASNWTALHSLAPDRFDAYSRPHDKDKLDAIARYAWNIDVSKALQPKLHALEVTFRNQLHNALTALYGANWYDTPRLLQQAHINQVNDAKATLTGARKPHDPGRIVASLSFGFWTKLYGRNYDMTIGRTTVHSVFPHYSGTAHLQRSLIAPILRDIRLLRNRVAHFEHVAFDPDLPRYHQQMVSLITWMNPQMATLSDIGDNVLEVYGRTWRDYRSIAEALFG